MRRDARRARAREAKHERARRPTSTTTRRSPRARRRSTHANDEARRALCVARATAAMGGAMPRVEHYEVAQLDGGGCARARRR